MSNVNKSLSLESNTFRTMLKLHNTSLYGRQLQTGFAFLNKLKNLMIQLCVLYGEKHEK